MEFSIVPLPPVDGLADPDFGNQHAFGAWLDAEEMDDEISSATDAAALLERPKTRVSRSCRSGILTGRLKLLRFVA